MYLHIYTSISQVLKLPETFINEKKKNLFHYWMFQVIVIFDLQRFILKAGFRLG